MKLRDLREEYEEIDPTDLSDRQMGEIVRHMHELITDTMETDDPQEAAFIALEQIAGFETDQSATQRTVAHLVDLYNRAYGV